MIGIGVSNVNSLEPVQIPKPVMLKHVHNILVIDPVPSVNHDPFRRGIKEIDISPAWRLKAKKLNIILYSDPLYVCIKIIP
ncbi:MAG: hypothetical protein PHH67_07985 [Methanosarcina sp.]|nr:hypothetical protein [Methanosarcina sp.]MDD3316893.1 hypothetical protein [Methanosarcina sp.]MDD4306432.1 hypothetical protein [Methanosarcina sp.]MDD4619401.1 hypothetical protein [Methanosarcina sp.]